MPSCGTIAPDVRVGALIWQCRLIQVRWSRDSWEHCSISCSLSQNGQRWKYIWILSPSGQLWNQSTCWRQPAARICPWWPTAWSTPWPPATPAPNTHLAGMPSSSTSPWATCPASWWISWCTGVTPSLLRPCNPRLGCIVGRSCIQSGDRMLWGREIEWRVEFSCHQDAHLTSLPSPSQTSLGTLLSSRG